MNFQQILLVLKREYITRIRSKAFIIATILIPLGLVAFMGIGVGIAVWDSQPVHTIGIIDQTNSIYPQLKKIAPDRYKDFSSVSEDSLRSLVLNEKIDGYIFLDEANINQQKAPEFVSSGAGGLSLQSTVQSDLREAIRKVRLDRADVSQNIQNIYESKIELKTRKLTKEGKETEDDTGFLTIVGVVMGVIIFMSVLGYGGLITRSVIEEKTNRIIEVIASSVKPIELLLGKMAGVGALALTQIAIWIVSILGLASVAGPIANSFMVNKIPDQAAQAAPSAPGMNPAVFTIPKIEPSLIILFVIFFILGYLIYSSLFAAVGSAVDSETDTQQFMFPIMLPIMIGYFIMFRAMANPDSTLAVVGSLIPFCAPIVMITRIAITDVPIWEILTSILLMIGTFVGTMWLSAKIYSVGILSYGKSASFKELIKWIKE
ncbi:MAG TPA: ABC transporter permease [Balneolaceae bacterium]|nr:ABC transporter permease [Balneolaceae bacterium]